MKASPRLGLPGIRADLVRQQRKTLNLGSKRPQKPSAQRLGARVTERLMRTFDRKKLFAARKTRNRKQFSQGNISISISINNSRRSKNLASNVSDVQLARGGPGQGRPEGVRKKKSLSKTMLSLSGLSGNNELKSFPRKTISHMSLETKRPE